MATLVCSAGARNTLGPISQNCRVRTGRVYSSVHNVNARWPKKNFKDIVNHSLKHPGTENIDVLMMSAPTMDITNLNTSNLQTSENSMFFQQQACLSSQNMFKLAEQSLENNLSLSKVVIMEQPLGLIHLMWTLLH